MKIGVKLGNSGPFAEAKYLRAMALEAERLGYDSVWVHDHITRSPADAEFHFVAGAWEAWERPIVPNVFESISTLLYLAAITERVSLGTSVVVIPLRHPVWLAKETACLDQFSNGRLILGLGTGGSVYARRELAAMGWEHLASRRGKVADEWIDVIRGVWREPKYNFEGQFIKIVDAEVFPKPVQDQPPIWIGGPSAKAMERVALRADGWLPMYLRPEELKAGKQRVDEMAAKAGRDPKRIQLATEHWLAIDTDRERAFRRSEATRKGMTAYTISLPGGEREDIASLAGREDDDCNLIGDPDSILAKVAAYQEAGVDHLILRVIAHSFTEILESMQMFKETVRDRLPR